jgi:hypothetical protein
MMYGFGDEIQPRAESIKLMEEMVIEYIAGLVAKVRFVTACGIARPLLAT